MPPYVSKKKAEATRAELEWKNNLAQLLFAHGDVPHPLPSTIKVLDSITTDYIIQICFGAAQAAALHNRAKVKIDDVLFALRKNPTALGKIEEMQQKQNVIKHARDIVRNPDMGDMAAMMEVGKSVEEGDVNGGGKRGKGKKGKGGESDMGPAFNRNLKGAFL